MNISATYSNFNKFVRCAKTHNRDVEISSAVRKTHEEKPDRRATIAFPLACTFGVATHSVCSSKVFDSGEANCVDVIYGEFLRLRRVPSTRDCPGGGLMLTTSVSECEEIRFPSIIPLILMQ